MLQGLHLDVSKVDQVLYLPPRLLLSRLGISSSSFVALHLSQTAEGARRGLVEGARQGMVARTRAHALSFSVTRVGQGYDFVVILF
jgi:hypothetical protein